MAFGKLGAMGRGFGTLGALGRAGTSGGPSAPVLTLLSQAISNRPTFTVDVDSTIVAGDVLRLQVQVAGGNWSSLVYDNSHTITSGELTSFSLAIVGDPLPNGSLEARCTVSHSGRTSAWSNTVALTVSVTAVPSNTALPVISGDGGAAGNVLSTTTGSWNGTAPLTYTYQWKKGGVDISGATNSTYTIVSGDAGASITVVVTATNSQGNTSATSSAFVVSAVPANTVAPAITGSSLVGNLLTCSQGTWTGVPTTYTYQWKSNGSNIVGSTASTYTSQAGDVGNSITCTVTASNGWGSGNATSSGVTIVSSLSSTYVGSTNSVVAGASFTFAGTATGAAGFCVIGVSHAVNGVTISAVTIGGVSCTRIATSTASSGGGSDTEFWYCAASAGGSQSVVVTMSGSESRCGISIWTLSSTPSSITGAKNNLASSASLTQTATIPSSGLALVACCVHASGANGTGAGSNVTLDAQFAFGNSSTFVGRHTGTTGSQAMGFTWTGAVDCALSIAMFGP